MLRRCHWPGRTSIVGKGLIVHRDPDDYRTQPTGNAGPSVATWASVPAPRMS
jgi:Cu/Zn superoxide dismutase